MLSRRLSLLRQSLDPCYELYFMELSSSITPAAPAKHHIARVRWKVETDQQIDLEEAATELGIGSLPFKEEIHALEVKLWPKIQEKATADEKLKDVRSKIKALAREAGVADEEKRKRLEIEKKQLETKQAGLVNSLRTLKAEMQPLDREMAKLKAHQKEGWESAVQKTVQAFMSPQEATCQNRKPYIFEITPAQSALNIARSNIRAKNFGIMGVFKTIAGLGVKAEYQKQREQYGQFMDRQVFVAGFGKGQTEFGWDFAPMAGEAYISPGNYTTYAVLAVPRWRKKLTFTPGSSWYKKPEQAKRRKDVIGPVQFDTNKDMTVSLPRSDSYWVSSIYYLPTVSGQNTSMMLRGRGFSPEMSVLVEGRPLERRIRLVDPTSKEFDAEREDDQPGDGSFEVVSDSTIVMRFKCGNDFVGIPRIALVSPTKSIHLNRLPMVVNGLNTTLNNILDDFRTTGSAKGLVFKPGSKTPTLESLVFLQVDAINGVFSARVKFSDLEYPYHQQLGVRVYRQGSWSSLSSGQISFLSNNQTLVLTGVQSPQNLLFKVETSGSPQVPQIVHNATIPYRPLVTDVKEASGSLKGGFLVSIRGRHLGETARVLFGSNQAEVVSVQDTEVLVRAPASQTKGKIPVIVFSQLEWKSRTLVSSGDVKFEYTQ